MSGSKAADVAAVGSVMRSMLRRQGYDMEEGTAVLAASAAMGETIPPSIAMLVLGSITTLSMASLFAAGIIPAAVLAVCLMVVVYFRARGSSRVPTQRASLQKCDARPSQRTSAADARHHRRGRSWRHRDANGGFLLRGCIRTPPGHAAVPRDGRSQAAQRSRRFDLDVRHDLADTRHGHNVLVDPDDRLSAAAPGGTADHCSGTPGCS